MTLDYRGLDRNIARTRIVVSLVGLLSIYVDPTLDEPFSIERDLLSVLILHLVYAVGIYLQVRRIAVTPRSTFIIAVLDVLFATVISLLTEGPTSPGQIFFAFAIMSVGCRSGFRATLFVTAYGVLLYAPLIVTSPPAERWAYVMRPVYLAIVGYLFSFLGEQRLTFEARLRKLEAIAQRQTIARSLHDGFLQALATVNLRLKTGCELLQSGRSADALGELRGLESGLALEYDDIRAYVRKLADVDVTEQNDSRDSASDPQFRVKAEVVASASLVEQILQIMLEALRNTRRHALAGAAAIRASNEDGRVRILIDDNGVGFSKTAAAPWSIASRVAQFGGRLEIARDDRRGAHLEIELPMAER
jgi:signal transduction histidine kinase